MIFLHIKFVLVKLTGRSFQIEPFQLKGHSYLPTVPLLEGHPSFWCEKKKSDFTMCSSFCKNLYIVVLVYVLKEYAYDFCKQSCWNPLNRFGKSSSPLFFYLHPHPILTKSITCIPPLLSFTWFNLTPNLNSLVFPGWFILKEDEGWKKLISKL